MDVPECKIVAIVGQTGSGKTALAVDLAVKFNGEVICCDSRTVYSGMKIGTASPKDSEMKGIKHHLLGITTPDKPINVAQFKDLCIGKILEIRSRGKLPFLVGGSGLYIDSVIFNYDFKDLSIDRREDLKDLSEIELRTIIADRNLEIPINPSNKRHLISTIHNNGKRKNRKLLDNCLVIGTKIDQDKLKKNIHKRTDNMIQEGLEDEVKDLVKIYDWDIEPIKSIGYREFRNYFDNNINHDQLTAEINKATLNYSKRQLTWFRRNKKIHWIDKQSEAVDLITTFLSK
jgi:tRNA dimethylallyltransferase